MKILSICIPTYNRRDCLEQCLESIVHQSVFSKIEVIVSDNASMDGTRELMQAYLKNYSNIRYSRNEENIGFDKNMLKVVSLATGKYCLFIGDDDAFFNDSLENIVKNLTLGDATYYITNNWGYDINLEYPVTLKPNLFIGENQKHNSLKEFITSLQPDRIKTVGFFGGMSGQIFLREKWIEYVGKEKFVGTQTIHLFVLLNVMKDSPLIIIAKPTIMTRADNIRWDTFHMKSGWKREMITLDAFRYIATIYGLPYSLFGLYFRSLINYIKNTIILYIKRYILRDQKQIMKMKAFFAKFISLS